MPVTDPDFSLAYRTARAAREAAVLAHNAERIAAGETPAGLSDDNFRGVNAQTGTAYTPVAGDASKLVTMTNAAASTFSVPQDSAAAFPVGSQIEVVQLGAGQVTVNAGAGATLRVSGLTAKARAQYSRLVVKKIAANTWLVFGDVAAA